MIKYIHCVFITHEGNTNNKTFLFAVNNIEKLKDGTEVLCETKYGETTGRCFGDSFMIPENSLKSIAYGIGAYLPLKNVVGVIEREPVIKKLVKRFDELPF